MKKKAPTEAKRVLLADLRAEAVAVGVCKLLLAHAERVNGAVRAWQAMDTDVRRFPIFEKIVSVVRFAQMGNILIAQRDLDEIGAAFYGSAERPNMRPLGDHGTAVGCAYIGAQARLRLRINMPVTHQEVMALSGASAFAVVLACGRGKEITAEKALAFLRKQGVSGFEEVVIH